MGKKQKKKKNAAPFSAGQAEDKAFNAAQSGDYRQAQILYRKLIKQDAEKFTPELINVQKKLLGELVSKKEWSELNVVLNSLEKAEPDNPALLPPRIRMALAKGDVETAYHCAAKWIAVSNESAPIDQECMADALVLAFQSAPAHEGFPEQIRSDLNSIHSALEAVGRNSLDTALLHIKPVGLKSLFCGWKWFIKGVCAFYANEDEKALSAFSKLPGGSVPEKAAGAYRLMIEGPNDRNEIQKSTQLNHGICLLMGLSEMAEPLARAHYLWQVERHRDSFKHLSATLTEFPTQLPGLSHSLTSFYYGAFHQMSPAKAETYLKFLLGEAMKQRRRHSLEKFKAFQAMGLWLEKRVDWAEEIVEIWEDVIDQFNALTESGPRADALVYTRLGNLFATEDADDGFFDFLGFDRSRKKGKTLRDADLAEQCYQKALKADPNSRPAHLALLSFYEKTENRSRINQTLDIIIKKFPDEKDALHKAGVLCVARNSLVKGLKYLEQALVLDPIDRRLRESFIVVCIKTARAYVGKGDLEKCVAALKKAEAKASQNSDDFNLGLPYLYARWANILHLFDDPGLDADRMLGKAISLCRDPLKLHYFTWLIGRYYDVPAKMLKQSRDIVEKALAAQPDPAIGAMLVHILNYCMPMLDGNKSLRKREIAYVNKYLLKAAGPGCAPESARFIVEYALSDQTRNLNLAKKYISLILSKNPDNVRFRWLQFRSEFSLDAHPQRLLRKKDELEIIIESAKSQGDQEVVQLAQKTVAKITEIFDIYYQFNKMIDDIGDSDDLDDDSDAFFEDDEPDLAPLPRKKKRSETASTQSQLNLFDFLDVDFPPK